MVDSTPTCVGPPSMMRSIRPPRSSSTCCAVVGETWPERLAEGATTGRPSLRMMSRATSWLGTRTAMLSRPAVASSATAQPARFFSTSVSGPGQNCAASRLAACVEHREPFGGQEVGNMGDQRIERRPALGLIEPCHRGGVGGVGAEAVDRLGRKRDQPAGGQGTSAASVAAPTCAGMTRVEILPVIWPGPADRLALPPRRRVARGAARSRRGYL